MKASTYVEKQFLGYRKQSRNCFSFSELYYNAGSVNSCRPNFQYNVFVSIIS